MEFRLKLMKGHAQLVGYTGQSSRKPMLRYEAVMAVLDAAAMSNKDGSVEAAGLSYYIWSV